MCELFGTSSSQPVELTESLMLFGERGGKIADNPDGWGTAYWDNKNWQLYKEPEAAAQSMQFTTLSKNLVTNLLIAHVRKANPPSARTLVNTHPFVRDCCGHSWVFAHNGKVPEVVQPQGCCHPHQSQPQGETDSEHAFYFLLDEIASVFSDAMSEGNAFWLQRLAELSGNIASYGQFNFLMSDGVVLIAYGHDRLHRLQYQHDGIKITLLASEPLSDDESWKAFQMGELQVYQEGELIGQLQTSPAWTDSTEGATSEREQQA